MSRRRARAAAERRSARAEAVAAASLSSTAAKLARGRRIQAVDALRGAAILLMIVYHFCFDLRYYRLIAADFEHGRGWLSFRALIVASFLLLVGVSLVLAGEAGMSKAKFGRRIAIIAGCAVAASIASYLVFPRTFIYFGILHCIVVASLLARPLWKQPKLALALGAIVIVAGLTLQFSAFDTRSLSWIGFTTTKPPTEDYVPLFPWAGVVLVGLYVGHQLMSGRFAAWRSWVSAPRWLPWLGRHSLIIYMIHQPILLGLLWLVYGR
jgi:uncharacterized membrane protein